MAVLDDSAIDASENVAIVSGRAFDSHIFCTEFSMKSRLLVFSAVGVLVYCWAFQPVEAAPSKSENVDCPPLVGAQQLLNSARKFYIVGEMHGTTETPRIFGDLVCNAAAQGAVSVALEYDLSATPALQRFIKSRGAQQDIDELKKNALWDSSLADGRSSVAMLELLMRLQKFRSAGLPIEVHATQPNWAHRLDQHYYELAMASEWVRLADANPKSKVLVLTGGVHAKLQRQPSLPFAPAASYLIPADVLSLRPETSGGEAWNCQSDGCKTHPLQGSAIKPRYIGALGSSADGYNGVFSVGGKFTASPPAGRALPIPTNLKSH